MIPLPSMFRPALIIGFYLVWNALFTLLILSVVTYFLSRSGMSFADLADTVATNRIMIAGIGAFTFAVFICHLNPILHISRSELITGPMIEQEFYPSLLKGAIAACLFVLAFLLAGYYRYVGFFVQSENAVVASLSLIVRALAIVAMVYVDEYVFRHKLPEFFKRARIHPLRGLLLCAFLYSFGKSLQFSLGLSHLLTLTLIGLALSLRAYLASSFTMGAGIFAGFLVVTHCVFSIPILGNDAQGFLLLRYQIGFDVNFPWVRFFTGGGGGLLSSVALQFVVLIDLIAHFWKAKKSLLTPSYPKVR